MSPSVQISQEILDILQDPHLDANPELHYQQKDEYSRLAEALEQLPFNEKQVLIMRYGLYQGKEYTQREIAEELGISRSYISRIEKNALQRLREHFQD